MAQDGHIPALSSPAPHGAAVPDSGVAVQRALRRPDQLCQPSRVQSSAASHAPCGHDPVPVYPAGVVASRGGAAGGGHDEETYGVEHHITVPYACAGS